MWSQDWLPPPIKKTQGANLPNGINWLVFVMGTGYFYNIGDAFL